MLPTLSKLKNKTNNKERNSKRRIAKQVISSKKQGFHLDSLILCFWHKGSLYVLKYYKLKALQTKRPRQNVIHQFSVTDPHNLTRRNPDGKQLPSLNRGVSNPLRRKIPSYGDLINFTPTHKKKSGLPSRSFENPLR